MVWYQQFEYAVGHWLQKASEHVFGCVLCCPGCFSLFRGSALMDDNVMKKYTTKPTEAAHYIQFEQGQSAGCPRSLPVRQACLEAWYFWNGNTYPSTGVHLLLMIWLCLNYHSANAAEQTYAWFTIALHNTRRLPYVLNSHSCRHAPFPLHAKQQHNVTVIV